MGTVLRAAVHGHAGRLCAAEPNAIPGPDCPAPRRLDDDGRVAPVHGPAPCRLYHRRVVHRPGSRPAADLLLHRVHRSIPTALPNCWSGSNASARAARRARPRSSCALRGARCSPSRGEIVILRADGDFTQVHLAGQPPVMIWRTLAHFESLLSAPPFLRLARSLIVNRDRLRHVETLSRSRHAAHPGRPRRAGRGRPQRRRPPARSDGRQAAGLISFAGGAPLQWRMYDYDRATGVARPSRKLNAQPMTFFSRSASISAAPRPASSLSTDRCARPATAAGGCRRPACRRSGSSSRSAARRRPACACRS